MRDYLVIVEHNPSIPDDEFMEFLLLYGLSKARAKVVLLIAKALGAAPVGHWEYEKGLERQAFLATMGLESRLVYTNKPPRTEIGALKP